MPTQFSELRRQVLLKLGKTEGKAVLAADQAINEAQKNIARVRDFDELIVLDTTNAFTVAEQKLYHITTDLKLVRPKDIFSIRYMDKENSRKLIYVDSREIDLRIPYTEIFSSGRPKWYTRRGKYLELFRIPNEAKPLYIMHSQWPDTLEEDTDEASYDYLDDVIVTLAADIANSIISEGIIGSWTQRTQELLGAAMGEDKTRPDVTFIAEPFVAVDRVPLGKYWNNPWVKKQPE